MRSVSIDVDVDLDEFRTFDLIEELRDRKIISEAECKSLLKRKEPPVTDKFETDNRERELADERVVLIEEASWRARRRQFADCLHYLGLAYPSLASLQELVRQ